VGYGLGVDLGTSFTAVAIGRYGRTRIVPLSDDPVSAASLLAIRPAGSLLLRESDDSVPVVLGGRSYPPVAVMAEALGSVLDTVTTSEGEVPEQVVLTCPAVWGPARRQQFGEVSRRVGLTSVTVVSEPEAAVTALVGRRRLVEDDVVVVYDLGGVTADMTVVRVTGSGMEILGLPEGADGAGGADFDDLVLAHVDRAVGGALSRLDLTDPIAVGVLAGVRAECVRAKEALSRSKDATVRVVGLAQPMPPVRLARAEFEAMVRRPLRSTLSGLHRVLDSAGVEAQDLTAVVLVGGSSRIPAVSRMLGDTLGRPVLLDDHPQHCVALGAAAIADGTSVNADGALRITPGAPPVTDGIPSIAGAAALMAAAEASGLDSRRSNGSSNNSSNGSAGPKALSASPKAPPPPTAVLAPQITQLTQPPQIIQAPRTGQIGLFASSRPSVATSPNGIAVPGPGIERFQTEPDQDESPALFRRAGGHRSERMGDWRRRAGGDRHGADDRRWRVVAVAVMVVVLIGAAAYVLSPLFETGSDSNSLIVNSPSSPGDNVVAPDPSAARRTPPSRAFVPTRTSPIAEPVHGPIVGSTGKCLDVVNSSNRVGARVQLFRCVGSAGQGWTAPGDGTLRSQGKCLQVVDLGFFNPRVVIDKCDGGADQQWKFTAGTIVNPASKACLDLLASSPLNRTPAVTSACVGSIGQRWTLRS